MAVAENERHVIADTTFGGLSPEAWDRLAGDRFYSTSAWLRFCTAETNVPGRAVVTRSGGEPGWAVPVRALGGLPEWTSYRWNGHLEEFGLPLLPPTGTLVGPPEGFQTHFLAPGNTFCALAPGAVEPLQSALKYFRSDFERHIREKHCPWS